MLYNCYSNNNLPKYENNNKNRIHYIFNLFIVHLIDDIKLNKISEMINTDLSNSTNYNNINKTVCTDNSINNIIKDDAYNNIIFNVNETKEITMDKFIIRSSTNQKKKIFPQKMKL